MPTLLGRGSLAPIKRSILGVYFQLDRPSLERTLPIPRMVGVPILGLRGSVSI